MNSGRMAHAIASVLGLVLTTTAEAQTQSVIGLDTVVVPTGDAQWLADWYDLHHRRSGSVFNPRIEVLPLSGVMGTFALRPNMVALLPASIDLGGGTDGLLRTDAGVSVCLALIATADGLVRDLGDLHAIEGRPRIAVARDVSHIVERVLGLYNLREKVEWIEADNESALAGIRMRDVELALLSASEDAKPEILARYEEDADLVELPPLISALDGQDFLFIGGFPLETSGWFEGEREYQSICDPIEAVTTEISRYRQTSFTAFEDAELTLENAGLFERAYAAIKRLFTVYE
ncbi:MAG: hypothetical protein ACO20O_07200 [Pseudomonadales bacterium]